MDSTKSCLPCYRSQKPEDLNLIDDASESGYSEYGDAPGRSLLRRFGRCLTVVVGSSPMKTVAGAMVAIGLKNDWMGDFSPGNETGKIIALVGAGLWSISTFLSTSNRPKREGGIVQHVAESVGFGVAGIVLVPAKATEYCLRPESYGRQNIGRHNVIQYEYDAAAENNLRTTNS